MACAPISLKGCVMFLEKARIITLEKVTYASATHSNAPSVIHSRRSSLCAVRDDSVKAREVEWTEAPVDASAARAPGPSSRTLTLPSCLSTFKASISRAPFSNCGVRPQFAPRLGSLSPRSLLRHHRPTPVSANRVDGRSAATGGWD